LWVKIHFIVNCINFGEKQMKIISYNVNGIRAAVKKGFLEWLNKEKPDVLCIQETKAQQEQIPIFEFNESGYNVYTFSAQKKGYSGVAILCKQEPDHVEYGMEIEKYDDEGRFIRADFGDLSVVSVYHPSGSSGDERQAFKMQWLEDYNIYINGLKKSRPNLVLSGDYNICHKPIDIHDPVRNAKNSGFLPEEREWMTAFLAGGFIDSFRFLNKEPHHYTWWSYRANARANNKGWRIDYHMVSENLKSRIKDAGIMQNAMHSDHCPCFVELCLKN
jgi:exodeoxyribonuclease-3